MKRFSSHLNETKDLKGDILVIVDVQKEFSDFIPQNLPEELNKYASEFKEVYQIWDGHKYDGENFIKIKSPSYKFNNEKGCYRKIYGTSASKEIKELGEKCLTISKDVKEGDYFRINDDYKIDKKGENLLFRIKNNHKWFYVNKELVKFFEYLKGKDVIICGGAQGECLQDVVVAMKSLGIRPVENFKFIYSAKDSNDDKINNHF